ncbi:hypothetical protein GCM10011576_24890 [Micromonospora parathelypteridis]|uniref:Uncharacterized protein n=1 Tax=Micromonospora parathelypteridis TaxID=1839617 RepID=A0A840VK46_9ACTN|nr:hypothetical protein [Micromonospora parathelypteridis]GGO14158.1 hypothetical protein GCM10011576_24890 [Micromonospora parathelypteridis]
MALTANCVAEDISPRSGLIPGSRRPLVSRSPPVEVPPIALPSLFGEFVAGQYGQVVEGPRAGEPQVDPVLRDATFFGMARIYSRQLRAGRAYPTGPPEKNPGPVSPENLSI